jgi:hypothetical protein
VALTAWSECKENAQTFNVHKFQGCHRLNSAMLAAEAAIKQRSHVL